MAHMLDTIVRARTCVPGGPGYAYTKFSYDTVLNLVRR
eukprot:SAG31_NODE_38880_length_292_cov_1.336788_1_plen_37_part_01